MNWGLLRFCFFVFNSCSRRVPCQSGGSPWSKGHSSLRGKHHCSLLDTRAAARAGWGRFGLVLREAETLSALGEVSRMPTSVLSLCLWVGSEGKRHGPWLSCAGPYPSPRASLSKPRACTGLAQKRPQERSPSSAWESPCLSKYSKTKPKRKHKSLLGKIQILLN